MANLTTVFHLQLQSNIPAADIHRPFFIFILQMILTDRLFSDFKIDATIIDALKSNNILHPSKTQAEVLPHALEGKDVLVRAKTGTKNADRNFSQPIFEVLAKHTPFVYPSYKK